MSLYKIGGNYMAELYLPRRELEMDRDPQKLAEKLYV